MNMGKGFTIGTVFFVGGTLGVQEFKHQDANVHSHQEPPGILDQLQGRAAMTQVSSGPIMWSSPPAPSGWTLDLQGVSARNERRIEALTTRFTPLTVFFS
jgi:hypothetical protein